MLHKALPCFANPKNRHAGDANAETERGSNSYFIPRHIIGENLINHHRDMMERLDGTIGRLIDELLINRNARDEHKKILEELLAEQAATAATPPAAAPTAAAATAVVIDDDDDIGKYDGHIAT